MNTATAVGTGIGAVKIERQFPIPQQVELPLGVQPIRSEDRPRNVLPVDIPEDARKHNIELAFPTQLTMQEAMELLGDEKVEVIVKAHQKARWQEGFCQWWIKAPKDAELFGVIYVYAKKKDITTSAIIAKAYLTSMEKGRNGISPLEVDSSVVSTSKTSGIGFSSNVSTTPTKNVGPTASLVLGLTTAELKQFGYPQAVFLMYRTKCKEVKTEKGWEVVCPPEETKSTTPPPKPKEEPKAELPKEVVPLPKQQLEITLNVVTSPSRAPAPAPKLLELPNFWSMFFPLNSAEILDFVSGRVMFDNLTHLQENVLQAKKLIPLFQQYSTLRVLVIGGNSPPGPEGTFKTTTKEGVQFDNNTLYNRGGLGPLRSDNTLTPILNAIGKEWESRFIVNSIGWNQNSKFPFKLEKVKDQLTKKELKDLEWTLQQRVDIIPAFYDRLGGTYVLPSGEAISIQK